MSTTTYVFVQKEAPQQSASNAISADIFIISAQKHVVGTH